MSLRRRKKEGEGNSLSLRSRSSSALIWQQGEKTDKTIDLYLMPLSSEVSQMRISDKINEMEKDGWEFKGIKIIDDCNLILIFLKNRK